MSARHYEIAGLVSSFMISSRTAFDAASVACRCCAQVRTTNS